LDLTNRDPVGWISCNPCKMSFRPNDHSAGVGTGGSAWDEPVPGAGCSVPSAVPGAGCLVQGPSGANAS